MRYNKKVLKYLTDICEISNKIQELTKSILRIVIIIRLIIAVIGSL